MEENIVDKALDFYNNELREEYPRPKDWLFSIGMGIKEIYASEEIIPKKKSFKFKEMRTYAQAFFVLGYLVGVRHNSTHQSHPDSSSKQPPEHST